MGLVLNLRARTRWDNHIILAGLTGSSLRNTASAWASVHPDDRTTSRPNRAAVRTARFTSSSACSAEDGSVRYMRLVPRVLRSTATVRRSGHYGSAKPPQRARLQSRRTAEAATRKKLPRHPDHELRTPLSRARCRRVIGSSPLPEACATNRHDPALLMWRRG